ncbi:MAG: endolytic transglycosylase MltG [Solirubrobacteraceae bacterium]
MSPLRGRTGGGSQPPDEHGSHPAAGGDWAEDLDWVDPRAGQQARRPGGLQAALARLAARRGRGRAGGPRKRFLIRRLVALAVLAFVVFAAWFLIELFQPFHGGGGASVTVSIPQGASGGTVGTLLSDDGVVSSSFFFDLRSSLAGDSDKFRAGVYTLKRGMSYGAALSALTQQSGNSAVISLTIPEGETRAQIAVLARRAGLRGNYLKASTPAAAHFSPQAYGAHKGIKSLEGFLFPATYYLYRHGWVSSLVAKQLAAFKLYLAEVNLRYARSKNLTPYDVITIASIIERESQLASDGSKVAAVIYNRLAEGIELGLDTTLLYYLHDPKGGLTGHDLTLETPYNTRNHYGLPPTPIANPGLAALLAAARPAHDSYLYFVVKPNACGALAFSTNQTTFDQDVASYNAAVKVDHGRLPDRCPAAAKKKK